jgi:hypothetical protein
MKKKLITFCVVLSVITLSTSAANAIYTVEPDDFSDGTDISTAFWGVTLSSEGSGFGGSPSGAIYSRDPSGYGDFKPSTGKRAFGHDGTYPHLFAGKDTILFRADFNPGAYAEEVSIDFIGNDVYGNGDIGELAAYDASDNLLDSAMTGLLAADVSQTITVSDNVVGIAYILAYGNTGNTNDTIGIDHMEWTPIPAPGAILLGSLGVGLVGWLRRRRTL